MTGVRPTVLFVEDDETLREATVQALTLEGFEVSAHADALSALRAVTPPLPAWSSAISVCPEWTGSPFSTICARSIPKCR